MPIPPDVTAALTEIGKAGALALLGYIANGVRALRLNIRRVDRLEAIVTGIDGDNGLRKAVATLEDSVEDHHERLIRLEKA